MALIKSISGFRGTIGGKVGEGLSPIDTVKFTAAFAAFIKELYNKYFEEQKQIEDFTTQEYSDLMANFNLAWFDPLHIEQNSEIAYLYNKQRDYTLEDRIRIIELQREIMRRIIPAYREKLEQGKIEIKCSFCGRVEIWK